MDAVEKAIRNALEKGDAQDRSHREKVYRSAFAALERLLESNPGISDEAAEKRRTRLKERVRDIESEFLPAVEAEAPAEPSFDGSLDTPPSSPGFDTPPSRADFDAPASGPRFDAPAPTPDPGRAPPAPDVEASPPTPELDAPMDVPDVALDELPEPPPGAYPEEPEPTFVARAEREEFPTAELPPLEGEERPAGRRRGPFAILFLVAILIAMAGIGYWWTRDSGILLSEAERDTSVPNPPKTLDEESFRPPLDESSGPPALPGEADAERDWVMLFSPDDPTQVTPADGTFAEVVTEGDETFLRVRASDPGQPGRIVVPIGQGLLEQLAGGRAVFDITARSNETEMTEISVSCDFANLGNCVRRRFEVDATARDYLFEVTLPDRTPGGGGMLIINPDIAGRGRAVNIFQIRVSSAN